MWCNVCDRYNVTWCHVKQIVWCDIIYMHSDVTGAHWGNQECSEVREPCSRTFLASLTVRVSWTYPPGLTYEASGPSTDRLKMWRFSVMNLPQLAHCSSVKSWGDVSCNKRVVSCKLVYIYVDHAVGHTHYTHHHTTDVWLLYNLSPCQFYMLTAHAPILDLWYMHIIKTYTYILYPLTVQTSVTVRLT